MSANVSTTTDDLAVALRRAHVQRSPLVFRPTTDPGSAVLRVLPGRGGGVKLDAHNALVTLDAGLTLPATVRSMTRLGVVFPLARPLPPLSWSAACAALPYVVDALVHSARGLTSAGDPWETPRAPRAAVGPSLLGALCARPPLAVATELTVRVALGQHTRVERCVLPDAAAAARRVRHELDTARALAVDALGATVLVLHAAAGQHGAGAVSFAHAGAGRAALFTHSESVLPGDVARMADALAHGARVVAAPFMGRAAVLRRMAEHLPLFFVEDAAEKLAERLALGAGRQGGAG